MEDYSGGGLVFLCSWSSFFLWSGVGLFSSLFAFSFPFLFLLRLVEVEITFFCLN